MAVNEYMHPRNRYRQKPNFQELVKQYPELNQAAHVDVNGKIKLDYKSKQSVELLSKCLLHRDFGLKLELPLGKLAPTLPLRLNYIHWIEDIGAGVGWQDNTSVRGIDIGCGASCIYPLLAVVQSNRQWQMLAIEKAEDSLQSAKSNVVLNELQDFIDVRQQAIGQKTILVEVLQNFPEERFDFCMCNPPFYDTESGFKPQNRTGKRRQPSNESTGSSEELFTEGGEVKFISQIIQESIQLKDRISVYTTMIGHKKSYEEILRRLKSASIHNITLSRFCQGNTTRWAVAWSHDAKVLLTQVNTNLVTEDRINSTGLFKPLKKAIEWKISIGQDLCSVKTVKQYLVDIFHPISVIVCPLSEKTDEIICELIAHKNTWSHQRRKRRSKELHINSTNSIPENSPNEKRPKVEVYRELEEELQSYTPFLKVAIRINRNGNEYLLALQYVDGIAGKDSVNQILQFIKNSFKTIPIAIINMEDRQA